MTVPYFMLPEKLCRFGSLREAVPVWVLLGKLCWFGFSQGSCADLGSLREAVLVWVLSRKLCKWKPAFREAVRVETRF